MAKMNGERVNGKVYAYSETVLAGVLVSQNDCKYLFTKEEWLSSLPPFENLNVTFVIDKERAKSILIDILDPKTT